MPIESTNFEVPEFQDGDVTLVSCSICNRSFNENAIIKHVKICKKVFVQKRKKFEIEGKRKNDEIDLSIKNNKESIKSKKSSLNLKKNSISIINTDINDNEEIKPKIDQIPLWKKNSDQLRNAMKGGRDPTFEEEVIDDRIPCPVCGRKFAEES